MPKAPRASLVEDVYDELAQEILSRQPGQETWLPNTAELSEQFGVSRTVVREAISRLESQGLVEPCHGVGLKAVRRLHKPVMASLSLLLPDQAERLRQATATRFLLEVEIARLAAAHMDESGLQKLREAQARLADPEVTLERAVEADTDFHQVLADQCGNLVLKLMLESIVELCRESRRLTIESTGFERPWFSHQRVVAAIEQGAPEAAADAMREHLELTRTDLTAQLAELEGGREQDHQCQRLG